MTSQGLGLPCYTAYTQFTSRHDLQQLIAAHRALEHHVPRPIHPVQREHALCQIDPHGSNLLRDFPSGYQIEFRHLNLGTSMPSPCRGSPFHSLGRWMGFSTKGGLWKRP